jgi:hypothetical protein
MALARCIAPSRPAEARKLLQTLLVARPAVSRVAAAEMNSLPK